METVIVASTANYPDALAAASAAGKVGVPVLLTEQESLPSSTASVLDRLSPAEVIVVGGPAVVSDQVSETLQEDHDVVRLWGTTRYGTATAIADHFWIEGAEEAVLVQNAFADRNGTVLAAAKEIARDRSAPLYLTPEGTVPAVVLNSLRGLGVERATVVGRTVPASYRSNLSAIGVSVEDTVTAETDEGVADRLQQRIRERMNATAELLAVATRSYHHGLIAPHLPDTVVYPVTSGADIAGLVAAVNARNVSSVTVTGEPALAGNVSLRLERRANASVTLRAAEASRVASMNGNLTRPRAGRFEHVSARKMAAWRERRANASEVVAERANRSLQLARSLVGTNSSDRARDALSEAEIAFRAGDHVRARTQARVAAGAVRAARYQAVKDDLPRLQERVREETATVPERVADLAELNAEFAGRMRTELSLAQRLRLLEEFQDRRRAGIERLMRRALEVGNGDLAAAFDRAREQIQESEQRRDLCNSQLQGAKESARGNVCDPGVATLRCPDTDINYTAENDCEIRYLEESGWRTLNVTRNATNDTTTEPRTGLRISSASGDHGENVTVNLTAVGESIASYRVNITYDPDVARVKRVDDLGFAPVTVNNNAGAGWTAFTASRSKGLDDPPLADIRVWLVGSSNSGTDLRFVRTFVRVNNETSELPVNFLFHGHVEVE